MSLAPEDVEAITPKVIASQISKMDNVDLELFHAFSHAQHKATIDTIMKIEYCTLHYHIAKEMSRRGLKHINNGEPCDKTFEQRITVDNLK